MLGSYGRLSASATAQGQPAVWSNPGRRFGGPRLGFPSRRLVPAGARRPCSGGAPYCTNLNVRSSLPEVHRRYARNAPANWCTTVQPKAE